MIVRTHQPRLAGGAAAGAGITGIGVWRPLKAKPIDEHVAALLPEQTPRAVGRALKAILKRVPIESVYCNDEHATPITMMRDSWADLCARTPGLDLASEGVDMVIWCGADKGCIEPGQAALACEVLGFSNTEWLDVSEACNGWLRALEIAQMYVHSAVHKRVLIMSAQENNIDFRPGNNAINSLLELPVRFAGYTIAAVATATLVSAVDPDQDMGFRIVRAVSNERPGTGGIPTPGYVRFCSSPSKHWAPHEFFTESELQFRIGRELGVGIMQSLLEQEAAAPESIGKVIITHSSSRSAYWEYFKNTPLAGLVYNTGPWSGNLADNTAPFALDQLLAAGTIAAGDRVTVVMNASGHSCVSASFNVAAAPPLIPADPAIAAGNAAVAPRVLVHA